MSMQCIIAIMASFAVSAALGPIVIPFLRRLKVDQTEREELKSHLKKTGTPTMGGIIILVAVALTSLFFVRDYPKVIPVLLLTLGFGAIGFLDDFLKVVLKRSDGLLAWQKMLCQIVVTAVFAIYLFRFSGIPRTMLIPFSEGKLLDLGWVAVPVMFLAVIGTVNGVNFTDGLDGLAASVTILVAAFFSAVSLADPLGLGAGDGIAPITGAVIGALMGFLLYNAYPAKVFMGDTGSLALGGFVAASAYVTQMPMFVLIIGLVYWVEIFSVMIQVTYFRKTGGKRFFKMAPIHHHFELSGWSETRVVTVFSIVTAILCLLGLLAL